MGHHPKLDFNSAKSTGIGQLWTDHLSSLQMKANSIYLTVVELCEMRQGWTVTRWLHYVNYEIHRWSHYGLESNVNSRYWTFANRPRVTGWQWLPRLFLQCIGSIRTFTWIWQQQMIVLYAIALVLYVSERRPMTCTPCTCQHNVQTSSNWIPLGSC